MALRKILSVWLAPLLLLTTISIQAQEKKITLEDIYKRGVFRQEFVPGFASLADGKHFVETVNNVGLVKKSFATGDSVSLLVNALLVKDEKGNLLPLDDYEWSADEKKLLIFTHRKSIYRRSSEAIVYAYDIASGRINRIADQPIIHATFSPNADKVAYVLENNLYIKDINSNQVVAVTNDGKWNHIINGNCDWVYEEEFEFTRAFEWNKQGDYLAYYRFDESAVPQFDMTMFEQLYPEPYRYKYPKAGEPNSKISIHIYQVKEGKTIKVDIEKNEDQYIPRIKWTASANELCVFRLNRLQNHLELLLANATNGSTRLLYEEKNPYYIEINDDIRFLKNEKQFVLTSEKDGFRHLYLIGMDGKPIAQITKGNYEVTDIYGIDEKSNLVYYSAAKSSPMDRQLFVSTLNGKNQTQLTKGDGWHRISFSNDFSFYVDQYSDINTPTVSTLYRLNGQAIKTLATNARLKNNLTSYGWQKARFLQIPNGKGELLNAWILEPSTIEPGKKYPVLMANYGGPGSQQVANRFGTVAPWQQYLAQQGYYVVCVDNTGTGFRGQEFKKKTYLKLGQLEIEDQIAAARYLSTMPNIDANRIGHYGWSFGGFMSSLAITKGADVFKAAIAVAPVTDWRYYDNIYTERFMQTPQSNEEGYKLTSPINAVKNMKGKFLIIHGTGDDNVHFQNSVMMVEAMIQANKEFESAYYPNKNHGIYGGNTTYHLWSKMLKWIQQNL